MVKKEFGSDAVILSAVGISGRKKFFGTQKRGVEVFLADAVLYLELFGIIAVAWQWLLQALTARSALERRLKRSETDFYNGKLFAFRYFFSYELPKIEGLLHRLRETDPLTVDMQTRFFTD